MEYKNGSYNENDRFEELEKSIVADVKAVKPNYFKEAVKWLSLIITAMFVALILRSYVFEWVVVDGKSMENTLMDEQVLFVNKLQYKFNEPKRGDIVIIQIAEGNWDYLSFAKNFRALTNLLPSQGEVNYIKRIVGLPGDEIDIIDGYLYINGEKQVEPYIKGMTYEQSFDLPRIVPENCVFVMGDNREYSKDSRQIGFIKLSQIKGKAVFRIKPFDEIGSIYD
ncbi:MAG: signal peptidase I [Clostridium sp.]|nr:signal peptidase I [Clostridium sp.]